MNKKETFFKAKKPTIEIQFAVRCYVASVCSFDTLKLKSKIMEKMEADRVANRTRKKGIRNTRTDIHTLCTKDNNECDASVFYVIFFISKERMKEKVKITKTTKPGATK